MKPPLPRVGLPTFRAALNRVILLPSLLILAGIVAGSLLIAWRLGVSLEEASAKVGTSVASGALHHLRDLEDQALLLSRGSPSSEQASLSRFERVVRLGRTGEVVWSWPPSSAAPLSPELLPLLLQQYDRTRSVQWFNNPVDSASGVATLVLLVPTAPEAGILVGVVDPDHFSAHLGQLAAGLGLSLALVNDQGQPLVGVAATNYRSARNRHNEAAFSYLDLVGSTASQVMVQRLTAEGWALQLSRPVGDIYSPLLVLVFVWVPLVAAALLLGLRWRNRLTRQLVGALETLKVETRRITQGDYSEVVESTPFEDLNVVLRDFESMRESVWLRQQDLKDSEYRFRRMFEDAAIGIIHTTLDGAPLDLNQAMARMLGYISPAQALSRIDNVTNDIYVRPEERVAILQMLQSTAQGRIQITTEFRTVDQRILIVNNHLGRVYDTHRGEFILEAFIEDVTEIKKAEQAVLELNAELERKVAERTRHLEAALEDLNAAQSQLVRSEKMAALGQLIAGIAHEINTPLGAITASNDNIAILLKKVLESLPWLMQMINPDQRSLFYRMYERAFRGVEVIPSAMLRQKRREVTAYLVSNGLEANDEMVDVLAELDLTAYLAEFLPLLQDPLGRDAVTMVFEMVSLEKSCLIIEQASDKAAKVIGALRTFSHEEQGRNFQTVDLRGSLEGVLTLFQSRLRHGVELKTGFQDVGPIWGYADRLSQVWTNLISNALQAMDYKGKLEITLQTEAGRAAVRIRDSGAGIPEHLRDRIFEPFFTTKKTGEGSGLGLDICRKIVEEHKGTIGFESSPGRTVFLVTLPLAVAAQEPPSND